MKTAQQSIWYPYAQGEYNNKQEGKNGNKRKKSETVLVVARLLLNDFYIKRNEIASICGISKQEVSAAIKKIKNKISKGHILIGLSIKDNEMLKESLELREVYKREMEDALPKEVGKLILHNSQITGREIAIKLNETSMNVSRALKKIKNRLKANEKIFGLTDEENKLLKLHIEKCEREQQLEKQRKEKEREIEKASSNAMKEYSPVLDKKKLRKKPATISSEGLAEWNRLHYDHISGKFRDEVGTPPGDLPKSYPNKKIAIPLNTPESDLIPAPPPKAAGTQAGRRKLKYLKSF